MVAQLPPLHIETPLIYSPILSKKSGANVYLKLENTQPCGSFKMRGISHLSLHAYTLHGPSAHLICSSGGNAGLACASSAMSLGLKCTIFVPITAKESVIKRLKEVYGSEVIIGGRWWKEADDKAREYVASDPAAVYIPPFDDPLVVEGHSTLISELTTQLGPAKKPSAIICSVGGGGLMSGLITGMQKQEEFYRDTSVVALETFGTASFYASLSSPTQTLTTLDAITSIASTLGATCVSQICLDRALEWSHGGDKERGVVSVRVGDKRAVGVIRQFIDDHNIFVEPACSVSLTPLYSPSILRSALPHLKFATPSPSPSAQNDLKLKDAPIVVVVVCGGTTVSLEGVEQWERDFAAESDGKVEIYRGANGSSEGIEG